MKTARFTESQIVAILKQANAGVPVKDMCRHAGISVGMDDQWKSKYGGLEASELSRVKELEAEKAKLKRMDAELSLDHVALRDVSSKNFKAGTAAQALHVLTQEHARESVLSLHRVVSVGMVQTTAGVDSARCGVDHCPAPLGGCASKLGVFEVLHVAAQAAFNLESQADLLGVQSDEIASQTRCQATSTQACQQQLQSDPA